MYSIVASDLDGTLLDSEHKVSPYTKQLLQQLIAKDIHFVFATGRHHLDVQKIREELGCEAAMITSNGARIHDTKGNLLSADNIPPYIAEYLISFLSDDPQICTNIYQENTWLSSHAWTNHEQFFPYSDFDYQIYQPNEVNTQDIIKIFLTAPHTELLAPQEIALKRLFGDKILVSFSTPTCLEITKGGVSKGYAIKKLSQHLGYELKHCIAFGDGMNDVEMLSVVGKGCIMENGQMRLKKSLPHLEIIGSNQLESVPHYLAKIYS